MNSKPSFRVLPMFSVTAALVPLAASATTSVAVASVLGSTGPSAPQITPIMAARQRVIQAPPLVRAITRATKFAGPAPPARKPAVRPPASLVTTRAQAAASTAIPQALPASSAALAMTSARPSPLLTGAAPPKLPAAAVSWEAQTPPSRAGVAASPVAP